MRRTTWTAVLALGAALSTAAAGAVPPTGRDVVFVANAEGGTVTVVDATTFEVLHDLDVVPDGDTAAPSEDPVQGTVGQRLVEEAGGDNLAQDQDLAPDGRTLFVSRGHRGDVAAFDLATGTLAWRTPIDGLRADHATLSPDGARLFVSSLTSDVVQVFDTSTGRELDRVATGEWPHDNHVSADGTRLYNASIGNIITPWETRQLRAQAPGVPSPYQIRIMDIDTLELQTTFEFEAGIRPFAVSDDGSRIYAQLSELHGVVEIDGATGEELRRLPLPVDEGVTEDDYSFEAPHHGLALSHDGRSLCLAGRASDYVALVDVATFETRSLIDVGDAPSWAASTPDGRTCVVPNTRDGTVSFVDWSSGTEVARVRTGLGPKHVETGRVPGDVLAAWQVEATPGTSTGGPDDAGPPLASTGAGAAGAGVLALVAAAVGRRRSRT